MRELLARFLEMNYHDFMAELNPDAISIDKTTRLIKWIDGHDMTFSYDHDRKVAMIDGIIVMDIPLKKTEKQTA